MDTSDTELMADSLEIMNPTTLAPSTLLKVKSQSRNLNNKATTVICEIKALPFKYVATQCSNLMSTLIDDMLETEIFSGVF